MKNSSSVVQTEFSDRAKSCVVYDVVMVKKYHLGCTYTLDVSCFLLQSCASNGVSRYLHLNLHETDHIMCEKIVSTNCRMHVCLGIHNCITK